MSKRVIPTAFLLAVILSSQCLAGTIYVTGTMETSANLSDRFLIHLPEPCSELIIRVPVPARGCTDDIADKLSVDRVSVETSATPFKITNETDRFGNSYEVVKFENIGPGNISIDEKLNDLDTVSDLNEEDKSPNTKTKTEQEAFANFMAPTKLAQSDDPGITALAKRLSLGLLDNTSIGNEICSWTQKHITYGNASADDSSDAVSVLRSRKGLCEGWANLFVALARTAGIPARVVGGYSLGGEISYPTSEDGSSQLISTCSTLSHAWVELWLPNTGWTPYDPQQTAGFVDSHHVRIWVSKDSNCPEPLITWQHAGELNIPLSFAEEEEASDVTDKMDLTYVAGSNRTGEPIMIARDLGMRSARL